MVKSTRKPDSSGRVTYYADTVGEAVTLERDYIHVGDRVFAKTVDGGGASLPEAGPYQYLVTDGNGQWGTADRLAYSIPAFSFECPASSVGLESFVVAGEEGDTTYYLISAGSYPLEGFKNMSITDPESQNVETAFYEQYGTKHTARFMLENGYGNFT